MNAYHDALVTVLPINQKIDTQKVDLGEGSYSYRDLPRFGPCHNAPDMVYPYFPP